MATFQITLPEELLQQAQQAGLLEPSAIEEVLNRELKKRAVEQFVRIAKQVQATNQLPPMSPEEVADWMRETPEEEHEQLASCA